MPNPPVKKIEREKKKESKRKVNRPVDTFLRKDRNTPKDLLRVSRCQSNKDISKRKVERPVDTFLRKDRNTPKDVKSIAVSDRQR